MPQVERVSNHFAKERLFGIVLGDQNVLDGIRVSSRDHEYVGVLYLDDRSILTVPFEQEISEQLFLFSNRLVDVQRIPQVESCDSKRRKSKVRPSSKLDLLQFDYPLVRGPGI